MFKSSSGSQSPPPLNFSSPADTTNTTGLTSRDSTPVTTPVGGWDYSSNPRVQRTSRSSVDPIDIDDEEEEEEEDCHHHTTAPTTTTSDFPQIFSFSPPTPPSPLVPKMAPPPPPPIDLSSPRQTSVSPPGQQASNLTFALRKEAGGDGSEKRSSNLSHSSASGISMFKAPPPPSSRKDSIGGGGAQWGNGSKPISVTGSTNRGGDKSRRESLAGSLFGQMSWGGVSVGSWIRDEYVSSLLLLFFLF